ncbi:hypothetical protein Tco_0592935 [Tanacetum coccineum]
MLLLCCNEGRFWKNFLYGFWNMLKPRCFKNVNLEQFLTGSYVLTNRALDDCHEPQIHRAELCKELPTPVLDAQKVVIIRAFKDALSHMNLAISAMDIRIIQNLINELGSPQCMDVEDVMDSPEENVVEVVDDERNFGKGHDLPIARNDIELNHCVGDLQRWWMGLVVEVVRGSDGDGEAWWW